jgi:hypothetical protein
VSECDAKLQALLVALQCHEVKLSGPAKRSGKNAPSLDMRTALRAGPVWISRASTGWRSRRC